MRVKLVTTAVPASRQEGPEGSHCHYDARGVRSIDQNESAHNRSREIKYVKPSKSSDGYLDVECGDGSRLAIFELQFEARKVMTAKAFNNGLKGRRVYWEG